MRTEEELLEVVYKRADRLRRTRRSRIAVASGVVATTVVAAGIVVAGSTGDSGDAAVVAGPVVGDTPTRPAASAESTEAAGRLEIEVIGVNVEFLEGMTADQLEVGPGHYPETPPPGHVGNSAMAGHRTTYGAPFGRLDELMPGHRIVVTTSEGEFTYAVRETLTVEPSAVEVIGPTFWSDRWGYEAAATLTLTTEAPAASPPGRLIVGAELIGPGVA